jgi:LDH2 family malate/lactate/ureidoglycolate dehydrogenase
VSSPVGAAPDSAPALEDLEAWARAVLVRAGLEDHDAGVVAASLAFAERRGVASHGLLRLGTYVRRIQAGGINRTAKVRVDADLGALVVLDADDGPGACTGMYATDLAIDRAGRHGIACIIARNAGHFGAAGLFTNRMADAGLVGLAMCNTESVMCAPAGGRPVLGTNPLAVAVPLPADARPQLDMATTTASQGKLLAAAQQGNEIPLGWAVDAMGRPTTSPAEGLAGALLPGGGPKGFGLAFAIDALLAVGGANVSPGVAALSGDPATPQRVGHLFLALRADAAGSLDDYRERIAALVDAVHASGLDPGAPPPMVPGEPELAHERRVSGRIELSEPLRATLEGIGAETGVPLPNTRH